SATRSLTFCGIKLPLKVPMLKVLSSIVRESNNSPHLEFMSLKLASVLLFFIAASPVYPQQNARSVPPPPASNARPAARTMPSILDSITFGDAASEHAHHLTADRSESYTGGLG